MSLPKHAFKKKSSLMGSGDSPKEDEKRTDFRRVIHIPKTVIYDIFVKILEKNLVDSLFWTALVSLPPRSPNGDGYIRGVTPITSLR